MIPPGFVQELLSRVDIVDVVGRHVELKRGGANLMGLCPFHAEKSPSFSVSPAKQFFYCFGCGASGDAIRFLTEHLGLSFVEAVRDLAQGAGMAVPEEQASPEERQRRETLRQRRASATDVLTRAADFYRTQLRANPTAIDYLKRRGLTGEIAARYGLGFAPPGWRTLAGVFPDYDDAALEEAGLVRRRDADGDGGSEGGDGGQGEALRGGSGAGVGGAGTGPIAGSHSGSRYDWFRNRVMFPIRGVAGEVIGFGGRVLDDSKPKYMNSPETPVFSKGRELYGLFEARQALRDKGYALVVEGYMDVVALAQAGYANTVATLGTACTADHVQKLFRFTDSVVFSFDGDAAGRRAAARALEAALPHATDLRSVRFLFLPPEHDPDSYVRELGAAAFEAQVRAAVPLSVQLVEQAGDGADPTTAEGRARLLAHARPLWAALPDGALKRQLLPELARRARLEVSDLAELWGDATAPVKARPAPAAQLPARIPVRHAGRRAPADSADLAARLLLRHSDWWLQLSAADHELLHGLGGAHGAVFAWLEQQITEHGPMTWSALDAAMDDHDWQDQARGWIAAADPDDQHRVDDLLRVVNRLWIARLGAEAQRLAAEAADSSEKLDRLRRLNEQIGRLKAALTVPAG